MVRVERPATARSAPENKSSITKAIAGVQEEPADNNGGARSSTTNSLAARLSALKSSGSSAISALPAGLGSALTSPFAGSPMGGFAQAAGAMGQAAAQAFEKLGAFKPPNGGGGVCPPGVCPPGGGITPGGATTPPTVGGVGNPVVDAQKKLIDASPMTESVNNLKKGESITVAFATTGCPKCGDLKKFAGFTEGGFSLSGESSKKFFMADANTTPIFNAFGLTHVPSALKIYKDNDGSLKFETKTGFANVQEFEKFRDSAPSLKPVEKSQAISTTANDLDTLTKAFVKPFKDNGENEGILHFPNTQWKSGKDDNTAQMLGSFINRYREDLAKSETQKKIFGQEVHMKDLTKFVTGQSEASTNSNNQTYLTKLTDLAKAEHRMISTYESQSQLPHDNKQEVFDLINIKPSSDRTGAQAAFYSLYKVTGRCAGDVCSADSSPKDKPILAAMDDTAFLAVAKAKGVDGDTLSKTQSQLTEWRKDKNLKDLSAPEIIALKTNPEPNKAEDSSQASC